MHTRSAACAVALSCLMGLSTRAEEADMADVAKGNNEFAFDLYRGLKKKDGNLFFSPYSITSALAMTWAGARGNTEAEMAKALRFGLGQDRLHAAMGGLTKDLNSRVAKGRWKDDPDNGRPAFELVVANALWAQKGYPFRKEYFELVTKSYGAGVTELDFARETEASRLKINGWVEERTNKRIQDLIPAGMLTPDARLVLTNAIYFKAAWVEPFHKESTKEEDFHLADGKTAKVPIMHRTDSYRYFDEGSFEALEMPYLDHQASMVVFVPKKADGLGTLEEKLTAKEIEGWLGKLKSERVALGFPKFKTTSAFELNAELIALGMKDAFKFPGADFKGMSDTGELFIGFVIHKSFVDVNEEGTEAAAATAVGMRAGGRPAEPLKVQVDRAFVFVIRDVKTGTVLFVGRVVDPR